MEANSQGAGEIESAQTFQKVTFTSSLIFKQNMHVAISNS